MIGNEERTDTAVGLRERKKQAVRHALSWAALQLAKERGLENVRVEDIAAAAGVSRRTFSNYFENKYEAIVDRQVARMQRTAQVLRDRPAGEPLWESLFQAMISPFASQPGIDRTPSEEALAGLRVMLGDPALEGEVLRGTAAMGAELARAVAERTGTDPARDLYPTLVATTALAAQHAALLHWLRAEPAVPLVPLLREALTGLAAGLPEPSMGEERR
ncbi:MAG TPA: TetR family transcriptional regulator [Candidatus Dormibacteraeota bacterium]|jgi:AcrR family transcriptional regulator|nr:TetR family transcriptional regulator [Candidatus Dormibacteraeota bacterium]